MAKKKTTKSKTTKKKPTKKVAKKVTKKVVKTKVTKKVTKKKVVKKAAKKSSSAPKKTTKKKVGKKAAEKAAKANPGKDNNKSEKLEIQIDKPLKLKTHLSKKELEQYRQLLLLKRIQIIGDVSSMSEEALNMRDSSNLSNMPIHMADVGSDNYEQELTLGLVESERKLLAEIEDALQRIDDRTYGVCISTGKKIIKARLDAKPWAKYCIEVAREMERGPRF